MKVSTRLLPTSWTRKLAKLKKVSIPVKSVAVGGKKNTVTGGPATNNSNPELDPEVELFTNDQFLSTMNP